MRHQLDCCKGGCKTWHTTSYAAGVIVVNDLLLAIISQGARCISCCMLVWTMQDTWQASGPEDSEWSETRLAADARHVPEQTGLMAMMSHVRATPAFRRPMQLEMTTFSRLRVLSSGSCNRLQVRMLSKKFHCGSLRKSAMTENC